MNDPFDDLFDKWGQTAEALTNAFWFDNLLPIEEIDREFACICIDIQSLRRMGQKAAASTLSAREKAKLDRLCPRRLAERIQELIDKLRELRERQNHQVDEVIDKLKRSPRRAEWHEEHHQATAKALADAESLCERLLKEFSST